MKYETPEVDFIIFDENNAFMTASSDNPLCSVNSSSSSTTYSSAKEALSVACGGYGGGKTNNFSCSDFGGYNASNPPNQNDTVYLSGGTYVFDYKGNHWKEHKGNN